MAGKPEGGRCGGKATTKAGSDDAISIIGGLTASSKTSARSFPKSRSRVAASSPSLGGKTGSNFSVSSKVQKPNPGGRASGSKEMPARTTGSLDVLTRRSKPKGQRQSQSVASKVSVAVAKDSKPAAAKLSVGGLTRKSLVLKRARQSQKLQASCQAPSVSSQGCVNSVTVSGRTKGAPKAPSKILVKSFAAGIALKGNRRDPKDIWTCPHKGCGVTFRKGDTRRSLSDMRATHLAKFHSDVPRSKDAHMREYAPPVLASSSIPEGERDWNCPWCSAG